MQLWGRNPVLLVFSEDQLHVFMVGSSGVGCMQHILATMLSRRRTFDAQCGLTAGLNLEAAPDAVWKSSDIMIYN